MSLPKAWRNEPTEQPIKKCKLGSICNWKQKCVFHELAYNRKVLGKIILISNIFFAIVLGSMIVGITIDFIEETKTPIYTNINGFNCNQLAEYIADKSSEYKYAEHRYEWLCVNEKIKEFQG